MTSVNLNRVAATKRLMKDLKELRESPVQNVSAGPLEDNLFEWHCCVVVENTVLHVILYFPDNYPHIGPAADFFPHGLRNPVGANRPGKKGTAFCMSLLSNYSDYHREWQTDEGYGWSPAYTVQSLLLNIAAAMADYKVTDHDLNSKLLEDKSVSCADCGHTCESPFPPLPALPEQTQLQEGDKGSTVTCYISRQAFDASQRPESKTDLFGFGLDWHGPQSNPYWSSPCEPLTYGSFERMKDSGVAQSSTKEEINFFLPLYLSSKHGDGIKELFEDAVKSMISVRKSALQLRKLRLGEMETLVLESLPNLMATTIEDFSNALEGSANLLSGFFNFHRLFLWAIDTYPGLQELIEDKIEAFLSCDANRKKQKCIYTEEWLMLLTVSKKYRWEDVAAVYITEVWHREIIGTLKGDTCLGQKGLDSSQALDATCKLMANLNKRLTMQMQFVNVANPVGMSREDVIRRYDDHLGFPSDAIQKEVRDGLGLARRAKTFLDWFKIWNAEVKSDDEIRDILLDAIHFAVVTPGYGVRAAKPCKWKQVLKSAYNGEKKLKIKASRHSDHLTPGAQQTSIPTTLFPSASISKVGGAADDMPPCAAYSTFSNCECQGPQPMDTSDKYNGGPSGVSSQLNWTGVNFLQKMQDEDSHIRLKLRPEMTINCLEQLKAKRRCEILRSSAVIGRPRRIRSCHAF